MISMRYSVGSLSMCVCLCVCTLNQCQCLFVPCTSSVYANFACTIIWSSQFEDNFYLFHFIARTSTHVIWSREYSPSMTSQTICFAKQHIKRPTSNRISVSRFVSTKQSIRLIHRMRAFNSEGMQNQKSNRRKRRKNRATSDGSHKTDFDTRRNSLAKLYVFGSAFWQLVVSEWKCMWKVRLDCEMSAVTFNSPNVGIERLSVWFVPMIQSASRAERHLLENVVNGWLPEQQVFWSRGTIDGQCNERRLIDYCLSR